MNWRDVIKPDEAELMAEIDARRTALRVLRATAGPDEKRAVRKALSEMSAEHKRIRHRCTVRARERVAVESIRTRKAQDLRAMAESRHEHRGCV